MKFKNPCFVRVEDAEKREKLFEWLADIGYCRFNPWGSTVWAFDDYADPKYTCEYFVEDSAKSEFIDCGSNVELFKALVAINDETEYMQWFVADDDSYDYNLEGECEFEIEKGEWRLYEGERSLSDMPSIFHKATTEEIIEHFTSVMTI